MTTPDEAKADVLETMAEQYDGEAMVAVAGAVERMAYKWEHHG